MDSTSTRYKSIKLQNRSAALFNLSISFRKHSKALDLIVYSARGSVLPLSRNNKTP